MSTKGENTNSAEHPPRGAIMDWQKWFEKRGNSIILCGEAHRNWFTPNELYAVFEARRKAEAGPPACPLPPADPEPQV